MGLDEHLVKVATSKGAVLLLRCVKYLEEREVQQQLLEEGMVWWVEDKHNQQPAVRQRELSQRFSMLH